MIKRRLVTVQGTTQMLDCVSCLQFLRELDSTETEDYLLIGSLCSSDENFVEAIIDSARIWNWKKILHLSWDMEEKWLKGIDTDRLDCISTVKNQFGISEVDECICCRNTQPVNELAANFSPNSKFFVYGDIGALDSILSPSYRKPDAAYLCLPIEYFYRILDKIDYKVVPKKYFQRAIDLYIESSETICQNQSSVNYLKHLAAENSLLFLTTWVINSVEKEADMYYKALLPYIERFKNVVVKLHPRRDKEKENVLDLLEERLKSHSVNVFKFPKVLNYVPIEVIFRLAPFRSVHTFISGSCMTLKWLYGTEAYFVNRELLSEHARDFFKWIDLDWVETMTLIQKKIDTWNGVDILYRYPLSKSLKRKYGYVKAFAFSLPKRALSKLRKIIRKDYEK